VRGDEEFVRACYREILQREADAGGAAYYLNALNGNGMTRQTVIDMMVASTEYLLLQRS
jgi:hypothetical protein